MCSIHMCVYVMSVSVCFCVYMTGGEREKYEILEYRVQEVPQQLYWHTQKRNHGLLPKNKVLEIKMWTVYDY